MDVIEQRQDALLREAWGRRPHCSECDRPTIARGLCKRHYDRARYARTQSRAWDVRLDLDELAFLIETESDPHRIAARLGYRHLATLQRALRRSTDPRALELLPAIYVRRI